MLEKCVFITCIVVMEGIVDMEESLTCMIKLKSWNYGIWKYKMKDLLYLKDLHEHIEGEWARSADLEDKKHAQLNQRP